MLQTALFAAALAAAVPSRTFRVDQTVVVPPQPAAVTLWIPLPHDDPWQKVSELRFPGERVKDSLGNEAARLAVPAAGATLHVSYVVERRERTADPAAATGSSDIAGNERWLKDDRLVQVDARIRALSAQVTAGQKTPVDKARAVYRYVISTMKYQKTGDGWGNGSIVWACTEKRGNCTDFHALFIGLLRAAGVPARFEIGRSVPPASGELIGYHCWADFHADGAGWIPVDASEAWKNPARRDYYFGHHDDDRFALSMGRDLTLPGMKGAPLNYFVDPYAELPSGEKAAGVRQTTQVVALKLASR